MIIHCSSTREAQELVEGLIIHGRDLDWDVDDPNETNVVVCECNDTCNAVYRSDDYTEQAEYTIDEIRDIIAAGDPPETAEGGGTPDLSTLSEEEAVPEHEDRDVSVFQGELWDTGTGSLNIPGLHDRIPSVGELHQDLMQSLPEQDLESVRREVERRTPGSFVPSYDGRREDSSTSQGLRGEAPRVGTPEFYSWRHRAQAEGREQD